MKTIHLEVAKFFVAIGATIGAGLLSMFQFTSRGAIVQFTICFIAFALVILFAITSRGPRIIALRAYAMLVLLAGLAFAAAGWRTVSILNG
jgi:hypothetical protein